MATAVQLLPPPVPLRFYFSTAFQNKANFPLCRNPGPVPPTSPRHRTGTPVTLHLRSTAENLQQHALVMNQITSYGTQHTSYSTRLVTRRVRAHSCVRETCVHRLRVTVYGIIVPFARGCRVGV